MVERFEAQRRWLEGLFKTSEYQLTPASEDASFRTYYRLFVAGSRFIVMDAPPAYEDCKPFIKISRILKKSGINVPEIYSADLDQGFLLLTDFGNDLYFENLDPTSADHLYDDAIHTLVQIQTIAETSELAPYDKVLLRSELHLFIDWLLGQHLQITLSVAQLEAVETVFLLLVENALVQPQVFVHRDFHSKNLLLTTEKNPAVIDYQDAVMGPISYDLVSLLKDCYIKWSFEERHHWLNRYLEELRRINPELKCGQEQFQRWFDLMGVQRHLKASGIFARLSHRDGKHGFLKELPRTLSYIVDLDQAYPELRPLNKIIEELVLPKLGEHHLCRQ